MENKKINISELLKDCPSGMELNCTMYDNVYFDRIDENNAYPIRCYVLHDGGKESISFTSFGTYAINKISKCVIFPKGKTTWEGFVPPCKFKDGDILYVESVYPFIVIYKENENEECFYKYVAIKDYPDCTHIFDGNEPLCHKKGVSKIRFATKEEKKKLFNVIKENGYRWNPETKNLEKLIEPKFKVGDRVKRKNVNYTYIVTISEIDGIIMVV